MMKSKSFDLKQSSAGKGKNNKSFDFVGLYKSAADTNSFSSEKPTQAEEPKKANNTMNDDTSIRERSPHKNKKKFKNGPVEVTQINIDGSNLNTSLGTNTPVAGTKVTSTPNPSAKSKPQAGRVKSIMKCKAVNGDDTMDGSQLDVSTTSTSSTKSKKRNKSVSFMLDDNEEVVVKKTKSDDSLRVTKTNKVSPTENIKVDKKKNKKIKIDKQSEKENKVDEPMETVPNNKKVKINKQNNVVGDAVVVDNQNTKQEKKKKFKKEKILKKVDLSETTENEAVSEVNQEIKNKKTKKKKRQAKPQSESTETEGEPATKSRKKDVKPELIAEDLENLSIGDNPHSLTNLLDEMTVLDRVKRKRLRQKLNKAKKHIKSKETEDLEKTAEEKEKIKWKKRKWNKDRKGEIKESSTTMVIVEGLPLSIMFDYKTVLSEHFSKLGPIKRIGIAEVYPTEESRPVFTTTITFETDEGAQLALDEDKCKIAGSRVQVRRPLPPTETTLVLRSYGAVTLRAIGTLLAGAGRIRNIHHIVKGKKAMDSVFIEFDGPEAVERALKLAEGATMGGKKLHAAKYEIRKPKHEEKPKPTPESDDDDSNE